MLKALIENSIFTKIYQSVSWPNWKSPITFGFIILGSYSLYAVNALGFGRNPTQLLVTVLTCYILDTLFFYIRFKQLRFTLGGATSGFGLFFLFDSAYLWMFFLLAVVTITIKHLFTYKDRHIFNPTNFALLLVCYAFQDISNFHSMRWGGELFWSLTFVMLGTALTIYAKRWIVSFTFIFCFILFAYIKSILFPISFTLMLLPILGPGLQLYSFFMITDPMTSPQKSIEQIIFSVLLALIDTVLRFQQNRFAALISLSTVCALFVIKKYLSDNKLKIYVPVS